MQALPSRNYPARREEERCLSDCDGSVAVHVCPRRDAFKLAKARQKIVDVLRIREGLDGFGGYAGDGHAVVPITDDRHTIENLLSALSPAMMPV